MADKKWEGTTYGNSLMHKWLIKLLQVIDIRMVYIFTYVFVIPPCLFRPGFKHIYHYFRQRWGYGPIRSFLKTYQNHCMFSQVVIDRFAKYAGKRFEVRIEGYEHFQHLSNQKEAFIQLSSHIGNYEMAGYSLISKEKTINALVFFGEKESVMKSRGEMFSDKNIKVAIEELLKAKDERGEFVFKNKKQWWAVYRVLFYYSNYPSQMTAFKAKMEELDVTKVDGKRDFSYESLSAATKEVPSMATCAPATWNTLKDKSDNYKQQYVVAEFLMLKLGIKS